ncbi:cytochrome oxidase assembly protein 1 [Naganishia albida]|nr:cytochrome oxidase assembly protein 1 [Naganishia albida]
MNALRHRLPTLTRPLYTSRAFTTSPLRRFPDADPAAAGKGETFSAKARPTSNHVSPEHDAGRSYIPPSPAASFGAVAKELADKRGGKERVEMFAEPARLRMRYERPKEARELPDVTSRWKYYLAVATIFITAWSLFLLHVTNAERLSSSVLRQVQYQLRNSDEVRALVGSGVRYAENWWGFGEPWISGNVNLPQGKVDLKFRIKGDKEHATVYFTSIRPEHNAEWRIVRYKLVTDSGKTLQMPY